MGCCYEAVHMQLYQTHGSIIRHQRDCVCCVRRLGVKHPNAKSLGKFLRFGTRGLRRALRGPWGPPVAVVEGLFIIQGDCDVQYRAPCNTASWERANRHSWQLRTGERKPHKMRARTNAKTGSSNEQRTQQTRERKKSEGGGRENET